MFRRRRYLDILAGLGLAALAGAAHAQDAPYTDPAPPQRLALVVGNAHYQNTTELPGSLVDADTMEQVLTGVGFTVTKIKDVQTRSDFLFGSFLPFLASVREGDIVAIYFSGHGFTYGGENYLAPLQFPKPVKSGDIPITFLSATGLEAQLSSRRPAFILMLLDACRNIGNFVITDTEDDEAFIAKGLAEPRITSANTVIGFSTAAGAISMGSTNGLSVYTKALAKHLPIPNKDLDAVRKDVRFSVAFDTRNQPVPQVPWFSESSSGEFYFLPSQQILDQQKELWLAALDEGTKEAVLRYLAWYGTGPYGFAARRWLRENENAPDTLSSPISPAAPEVAWSANSGTDIILPRIEGALAPQAAASAAPAGIVIAEAAPPPPSMSTPGRGFARHTRRMTAPRRARLDTVEIARRNADDIMIVAQENLSISNLGAADPVIASAEALSRLGEAVTTTSVDVHTQPNPDAPVFQTIEAGTSILIEGTETDGQGKSWMRGRVSAGSPPFYVEQKRSGDESLEIGQPLAEVSLPGRTEGLKSLVDEAPLLKTLDELKSAGKTVVWVSIATPKADGEAQTELYGLQATYLRSILAKNGVPRKHVTTVQAASVSGGDVRLRIFGR